MNNQLWQPTSLWRPILDDFEMNLFHCCAWMCICSGALVLPEEMVNSDNSFFLSVYLQDIQAEIDAHNDIYKSVDGNKSKMVKALGSSEEAVFLQHRLDDMNQRWSDLKAKSANIRSVNLYHILTEIQTFLPFLQRLPEDAGNQFSEQKNCSSDCSFQLFCCCQHFKDNKHFGWRFASRCCSSYGRFFNTTTSNKKKQ